VDIVHEHQELLKLCSDVRKQLKKQFLDLKASGHPLTKDFVASLSAFSRMVAELVREGRQLEESRLADDLSDVQLAQEILVIIEQSPEIQKQLADQGWRRVSTPRAKPPEPSPVAPPASSPVPAIPSE